MKKLFLSPIFLFATQLSAAIYLEPSPQFKPKKEIAVVYIEHNDNILLLHRQDTKSQGNRWGIPGGKIEKNENPVEAVIREVKEETGYDLSKQPIKDVGVVYVEHNETDHFIHHMFRTRLSGNPGDIKIDFKEHKGFTWVTPADGLRMDLMQDEDSCFRLVYFPEKSI